MQLIDCAIFFLKIYFWGEVRTRQYFPDSWENLSWLEKLNELRRDPSHPEKPAPEVKEVDLFEKIKKIKKSNCSTT